MELCIFKWLNEAKKPALDNYKLFKQVASNQFITIGEALLNIFR